MVKKTMLILGGKGFIGSALVRYFTSKNYDVFIGVRTKPSNEKELLIDITEKNMLKNVADQYDFDIVINCAAIVGNKNIGKKIYDANVKACANIMHIFKQSDLIFFGSADEYDAAQKNQLVEEGSYLLKKRSLYGLSKFASTTTILLNKEIEKMQGRDRRVVILRPFTVFGEGDWEKRVVPDLIIGALKNKPVKMGNPQSSRDFIYVQDVATAINTLLDHQAEGIFNVCSGKNTTYGEMHKMIENIFNKKIEVLWNHYGSEKDCFPPGSNIKLKSLGWSPTPLTEGLKRTATWFKQHYGG